jgi:Linalool dehydratase/isomerase
MRNKPRRILQGLLALFLAAAIWLPSLHLFYSANVDDYFAEEGIGLKTRLLADRQLKLWTDPELRAHEIYKMRGTNAEWDFMGRSYLAWALANMALRDPGAKDTYLEVIDRIIDETIKLEEERGHLYFLMNYAKGNNFMIQPNRSLFIDGEIALMLGMRRIIEEKPRYEDEMRKRIDIMIPRMKESEVLCAESYPYECWMFCNAVALAAIKVGDYLDDTDHSEFFTSWIETAKEKMIDKKLGTGMLASRFTPEGRVWEGPEGSSIWMSAHCLQVIDAEFARDQYDKAREALGVNVLGFAYSREWPRAWKGVPDVDSGPIIPFLETSAGASGLAFLGASSFGDREFLSGLVASINLAGFPVENQEGLKYCASNQVGDAVLLYAMTCGPVWKIVMEEKPS